MFELIAKYWKHVGIFLIAMIIGILMQAWLWKVTGWEDYSQNAPTQEQVQYTDYQTPEGVKTIANKAQ